MQYVESENKSKIEQLLNIIINSHMTPPDTVVSILTHLTQEKYALNYDSIVECVGKEYKTIREQEIGEFVGINSDVYYCEYENDIIGGYQKEIEDGEL